MFCLKRDGVLMAWGVNDFTGDSNDEFVCIKDCATVRRKVMCFLQKKMKVLPLDDFRNNL